MYDMQDSSPSRYVRRDDSLCIIRRGSTDAQLKQAGNLPGNELRAQILNEVSVKDRFFVADLSNQRQKLKAKTKEDLDYLRRSFSHLVAVEKNKKA